MACPACRAESPAGSRFCPNCGAALGSRCGACGAELPGGARFCNQCGAAAAAAAPASPRDPRDYTPRHLAEKILATRSALEGERKQVTVLFADVKGSQELAESVDPEEWHRILERFFQILADGVHRFEGTVNQYTGDGIMALFGAPIAHEDHAQRACYAALHLRDELRRFADELRRSEGLSFSVRMGLNSGEVVVGKIGDDLRMDYTAQGPVVGLAARVEQTTAPDRVHVTGGTARLVEGFFSLRDRGPFRFKGVPEATQVFELEAPGALRTRFEVARARGLTRFVGRDGEMRALETALARAREGDGQVVGVVAEAGVGKSRLCAEFVERCRAQGLAVNEGRALSHGKNVPLLPILQAFRANFGITDQDGDQAARDKIAGRLLLIDEAFRGDLPLVFDFFGVPDPQRPAPSMDSEARQRRLFGVLHRAIQTVEGGAARVTLLEDLHWLDPVSEAWLEQWVGAVGGSRSLLLVNFRPEYHAGWMQKSYYQQLPLAPLRPEALREMLEDLLGRDPSVAGLAGAIHGRTRGNPFFTEEVVQSLVESGDLVGARGRYRLAAPVEALEVPSTVQSVLAARIDRLPEREKQVLQTAAVIGKEFPEPVLEAVVDLPSHELRAALAVLKDAEFLYEQSLYPEAEYAFKHPLTQEVALRSQLLARRQRVHVAVARALETASGEKLEERAALLAHHWEEAGERLEAARWNGRAARWTEETDPSESLRRWQRARTLLADATGSRETTPLRLEACRGILSVYWRVGGSEVDSVFAEGKALAEQTGDLRLLAILYNLYGNAKGTAGDLRAYHELASEALRLAEGAGDAVFRATIASDAHPFCWTGRLREALLLSEKAIALGPQDLSLGRDLFGVSAYLSALMFRGSALVEMGRLEEAAFDLDRASQHPAEQPTPFIFSQTYHVVRAYRAGDAPAASTHARRALERAEEVAGPVFQVLARVALGIALLANREWSAAEAAEQRALALARERRVGYGITAWALCFQAEARLGREDPRGALELADAALADARQGGARLFEMDALLTRARALLRLEGPSSAAEVERALAQASGLIDETGARSRAPVVHELSAELARLRGDLTTRERELREARRLFTEMGAAGHAERLAREIAP
jgi:adenylate cyclase